MTYRIGGLEAEGPDIECVLRRAQHAEERARTAEDKFLATAAKISEEFSEYVNDILKEIARLARILPTDDHRIQLALLLAMEYCRHCGRIYHKGKGEMPCQCWNDE